MELGTDGVTSHNLINHGRGETNHRSTTIYTLGYRKEIIGALNWSELRWPNSRRRCGLLRDLIGCEGRLRGRTNEKAHYWITHDLFP